MDDPKLDWEEEGDDYNRRATATLDGFDIVFTVEVDCYADVSYLGEFKRNYVPGAVDWQELLGKKRSRWDRAWYVSCNHNAEKPADDAEREAVIEDIKRLLSRGEEWDMTTITVTVFKSGVKVAQHSLGGVESDCDKHCPGYRDQTAWELAHDAIREAKEEIPKLVARLTS